MKHHDFLNELKLILVGQKEKIIPEEEYLRKLLFQVELNSLEQPTAELILKIFKDALNSESVKFEIDWYDLREPELFPDLKKMTLKDELELTKNTIKFLISDLRRLGDKVLKDPNRGLGVSSSKGGRWYNFDICSIVYGYESFCYDALFNSENDEESNEEQAYSWSEISSILLFGKGYE